MLEVKQRWLEVLRKTSIFSRLTTDQMAVVLSSLFIVKLKQGKPLSMKEKSALSFLLLCRAVYPSRLSRGRKILN